MKRTIGLILISVLAAGMTAACGRQQKAAQTRPVVTGVKLEVISPSPVDEYYEAVGTVRSKTSSVLSAKVVGSVTAVHVREGDRVRPGQVLVEIDNRDTTAQLRRAQAGTSEAENALQEVESAIRAAESAVAAAEANKALATSTYNRFQALLERRSVSQQEFDEAQAKYQAAVAEVERLRQVHQSLLAKKNQALAKIEQAKAEVTTAQVMVGYARVTAPIAGIVVAKHVDVGMLAAPGVPLLTIEDGAQYRLETIVDESQLDKIRSGDRADVRIDALGDKELDGRVVEIVPAADPRSRTYTVKIDLPMQSGTLRSGLYGRARFKIGQRSAITIQSSAIVRRGQLVGVYVVDSSGIARLRLIQLGKSYGERVEVLAGLNEGERIVVENVAAVTDGSQVQ
ncbi:MAG: efflux RND transporter periplasmic adaptor subunit [Acidobacteriota bacterium]|nr:efflux RND transporter periplasmic adaptor subunit [Blastocatellia bacterium]MDW8239933.1 efflux RND transporter periplasmic adaptor subunit [Acidobacteriota bacterium]